MARLLWIPVLLLACGRGPRSAARALPPLAKATLTTEQTLAPAHAFWNPPDPRNPEVPSDLRAMLADGLGDYTIATGETPIVRTPPGEEAPPAPGPNARRLVRFVHLTDIQLADDESPTRVASLDGPGALDGAFRPQEADLCRILNAAVRTVNAVHAADPIDFVLTGGDTTDSAQTNELEWAMGILDGGAPIECDSGEDDDPIPGLDNDGKDPFLPVGLDVPWFWITGNHDVCAQGNFVIDEPVIERAIGGRAETGTRDWRLPGGPVVTGEVPADPRRRPLRRAELMAGIAADGDGHGVGPEQLARGRAFYTFDIPDTPLRFFILDTAAESGGSEGIIHRIDLEQVIEPVLARAAMEHKWLVLASHHALGSVGDGGDFAGHAQEDAVPADELRSLFSATPNVVAAVVGHSHVHRVDFVRTSTSGAQGWWELFTSALSDHPSQLRVIEIWDQDDGYLMLRAIDFDFATDGDAIAEDGRRLGVLDRVSGWWGKGTGQPEDRNVELWVRKPPARGSD